MQDAVASGLRAVVAQRIQAASHTLASRWLELLTQIVAGAPPDIFPGDQLEHAEAIIRELATYLATPDSIAATASVTARAMDVGHLRHAQRASAHQILREYRLLRSLINDVLTDEIEQLQPPPKPRELMDVIKRLDAGVDLLLQTTLDTFVAEYTEAITRHANRLEGFNRMVTHELRQPLGTFQFAVKLLGTEDAWTDREKRDRLLASAERNVARMSETLAKLVALSRSTEGAESALVQHVEIAAVANDVIGQLQEMADARGVDIRIVNTLPSVTIDVARLELVLVNLMSNAIKYSDPDKPERVVEIASAPNDRAGFCTLTIRDNGIGIAETDLRSIFARFYRGRALERNGDRQPPPGLGLGLSIVSDCVDALKGDIHVESVLGEGTTFFLELPVAPEA